MAKSNKSRASSAAVTTTATETTNQENQVDTQQQQPEASSEATQEQQQGSEASQGSSVESQETSTQGTSDESAPAAAPTPVSAPAAPAPAPVQAPAPAPQVQVKETAAPKAEAKVAPNAFEITGIAGVDRLLKDVPAARLAPIHRLVEYVAVMAPKKPVTSEDGARQQAALFKTLQNVINREDEYFRPLFAAILAFADAHKAGAFHETHVFRFMEFVVLPENERKAFQRLLNLVKVAAAKEGRAQAIKQVNFTDSLRYGLTDDGRQRVLEFFNVGA